MAYQLSEILSSANATLIRNFNPAQYNPEVIDIDKLSQAVEMFGHTKGAMGKNGPLKQVLINGKMGTDTKISLKGPMYELEKAIELANRGEIIIEFGQKIQSREFDIITETKVIECKNWDWDKISIDQLAKLKSTLPNLNRIAASKGKKFEFYSRNQIPLSLKKWLHEKNITFFEG